MKIMIRKLKPKKKENKYELDFKLAYSFPRYFRAMVKIFEWEHLYEFTTSIHLFPLLTLLSLLSLFPHCRQ